MTQIKNVKIGSETINVSDSNIVLSVTDVTNEENI